MEPRKLIGPGFLKGTLIRTENGDVPIETLRVGDYVLNAKGEKVQIKEVALSYKPNISIQPEYSPVIIKANILATNTPSQDLHILKSRSIRFNNAWYHVEHLPYNCAVDTIARPEYFDLILEHNYINNFIANGVEVDCWDHLSPHFTQNIPNAMWYCEAGKPCKRGMTVKSPLAINKFSNNL